MSKNTCHKIQEVAQNDAKLPTSNLEPHMKSKNEGKTIKLTLLHKKWTPM